MKTIRVKVPDELAARLMAVARRRRTSTSEVVREAIGAYLRGNAQLRKSIGELASDLIGSVEGPGDLSHNSRYLDDFGR
jgi:Arc/MetJ-type ribon-helix-helix transcriptional regulator